MNDLEGLLGLTYRELIARNSADRGDIPALERIEDQSYVEYHLSGISFVFSDNGVIGAVQLHAVGHEGFAEYGGNLPGGLFFSMNRVQVRNLLGDPDRHGEEERVLLLGVKPAWDSFLLEKIRLHVEYAPGEQAIQLVTITAR